ncbi:MAG: hypothetical protein JWO36_5173 [Myxococcales bacterium]|nr:hypothetical protein [Myxococcales bacterium]
MLGIRWTIGDVNPRGFDALRLSVWGAFRLFGEAARYVIYVNTIPLGEARARTADLPDVIEWQVVERAIPACLERHLDGGMAEGVAWKLVPLRAFPDDHELALDNDVVLWGVPPALARWLADQTSFLLAADVSACFGKFASLCGERPINTGIRGLPPGFCLETAIARVLSLHGAPLVSETDEQGLQVAAIIGSGPTAVIDVEDVTICSPFPPHVPHLGRSGAHFVGLNTRRLGWTWQGRAAEDVRAEHWDAHVLEIARRVGM